MSNRFDGLSDEEIEHLFHRSDKRGRKKMREALAQEGRRVPEEKPSTEPRVARIRRLWKGR